MLYNEVICYLPSRLFKKNSLLIQNFKLQLQLVSNYTMIEAFTPQLQLVELYHATILTTKGWL